MRLRFVSFVLAAVLVFFPLGQAHAAKLSSADRAWIATCIKDRALERRSRKQLQRYCTCMQEIVEDNRPFTVTELERSYPPAHRMCRRKAGIR